MASHKKENKILLTSCLVTAFLLFKFVPKKKCREAQVCFLFQQVITWFVGLLVVEKGLISYPYRFIFEKACKSSFIFEYFIHPAITALFNLHYPEKRSNLLKVLYTFSYTSVITLIEIFLEKHTKLIRYKKWRWYWTFISLSMTYYLSQLYFRWFFRYDGSK